jgi:hypothetical protein
MVSVFLFLGIWGRCRDSFRTWGDILSLRFTAIDSCSSGKVENINNMSVEFSDQCISLCESLKVYFGY